MHPRGQHHVLLGKVRLDAEQCPVHVTTQLERVRRCQLTGLANCNYSDMPPERHRR